ncbi:hypothetical protein M413DRAFT_447970 [Hebeloma cylindrosporum]|uniref:Uncharacterized protein n=1 Tax=Hebeloma cylindrosporum TaxID=76867 RepID=A0A0C3BNJ3_HEBCY|nr:hypothetical protein M413DRAFT_447970 [Hebeloma cylindrosporum h7]
MWTWTWTWCNGVARETARLSWVSGPGSGDGSGDERSRPTDNRANQKATHLESGIPDKRTLNTPNQTKTITKKRTLLTPQWSSQGTRSKGYLSVSDRIRIKGVCVKKEGAWGYSTISGAWRLE